MENCYGLQYNIILNFAQNINNIQGASEKPLGFVKPIKYQTKSNIKMYVLFKNYTYNTILF